jgi:hypothetical protein
MAATKESGGKRAWPLIMTWCPDKRAVNTCRRTLISSALAPAGAAELDDDPLSWFAQQAPPRAQPPRRWQNKKDTGQPRQPDQRRTGQPSAEHSDLGASVRFASQLMTRTESAIWRWSPIPMLAAVPTQGLCAGNPGRPSAAFGRT